MNVRDYQGLFLVSHHAVSFIHTYTAHARTHTEELEFAILRYHIDPILEMEGNLYI